LSPHRGRWPSASGLPRSIPDTLTLTTLTLTLTAPLTTESPILTRYKELEPLLRQSVDSFRAYPVKAVALPSGI